MPELVEGNHSGDFILSEANFHRSRDKITIASGVNLKAGAVVGKITASGKYTEYDNAATDGSQTAAGVIIYATDASSADKEVTALVRDCELLGKEVVWADGMSQGDKDAGIADLAALGVIVRA